MQHPQPKRPPVAQLYPPEIRDALVRHGLEYDPGKPPGHRGNIAVLDQLTDNLVARGYCRPRNADSQPERKGWHQ